jgi:hypothetical protein
LQLLYQIPWGKIDPPEDGLQKLPSIPGFLEGVKCGNLGQNDWSSIGHGEFAKREVGNYITKNTVIYCIYSKLRCFSNYLRNYQANPYYSHSPASSDF